MFSLIHSPHLHLKWSFISIPPGFDACSTSPPDAATRAVIPPCITGLLQPQAVPDHVTPSIVDIQVNFITIPTHSAHISSYWKTTIKDYPPGVRQETIIHCILEWVGGRRAR